jgi:very-short-patch-repair endonuclease
MILYKSRLKKLSGDLRKNSTEEEIILWSKIRKRQILNIQFYRQKPLHGYIADFYAPKINLVIELDGSQHYQKENEEYDLIRSNVLLSLGLNVKRYNNYQIRHELTAVLNDVYCYIKNHLGVL